MNKQVKQKWVKALRSGKYKQGIGKLCYGNQNGKFLCCLGVLSTLAVEDGVCSRRTAFKGNNVLNYKVMQWAGLQDDNPDAGCLTLTEQNDDAKLSFKQIADLIEKKL